MAQTELAGHAKYYLARNSPECPGCVVDALFPGLSSFQGRSLCNRAGVVFVLRGGSLWQPGPWAPWPSPSAARSTTTGAGIPSMMFRPGPWPRSAIRLFPQMIFPAHRKPACSPTSIVNLRGTTGAIGIITAMGLSRRMR